MAAFLGDVYGRLKAFLSVPDDDVDLLKAQYRALAYQLPMLYSILLISSWVMAYPHLGKAPVALVVVAPGLLSVLCITRGITWWSRLSSEPSAEIALSALRFTNLLAPIITCAFILWSLLLFPHGDADAQGQIIFFLGITAIGCIFCLMHLRSAAFLVALIDNVGMLLSLPAATRLMSGARSMSCW
ncbi:putative signaling protein [Caenibius tardaugens NBRC 16725]|uniref:Putative signaling protein n=1 Tax=Caenibius tardaugens NBRC 16725 TaxID=1219035 RepID=U2YNZ4_9SPHN|nr:hypothetical protein [Caenibius tardaugens]GAD50312.1 putative signaling protein [Caenibius tardaugens NBRC 16725]